MARPRSAPHTIVTDAGSTKQDVIAAARAAPRRGAAALRARASDRRHRAHRRGGGVRDAVSRPQRRADAAAGNRSGGASRRSRALWTACGARVRDARCRQRTTAIFAAVSHLPHLLAFALVDQLAARPDAAELFRYAASGFRDFTRIAAGSPEMWRDIALANRDALLAEIDAYRAQLDRDRRAWSRRATAPRSKRCSRARPPRAARGARNSTRVPPSRRTGRASRRRGCRDERADAAAPPSSTSRRASRAEGVVALPGSKSISNRTLLLAALAAGDTTRARACSTPTTSTGCWTRCARSASRVERIARHARLRRARAGRRRFRSRPRGSSSATPAPRCGR